jgi:glycosyltransferase involved in cell wall biosynthesis
MGTGANQGVRVIIAAEHASARFGGEAILPLHYFRFLRERGVEAWLVVHERTERELSEIIDEADQDRIYYIPDTRTHRFLWRLGKRLPSRIAAVMTGAPMHLLTQVLQRRLVKRLVGEHGVTVVHEPIPVSPKQPSYMHGVGAPVIIGPMNGGMRYPKAFADYESPLERLFLRAGRSLAGMMNLFIRGKHRAALLLVANERTRQALPGSIRTSCEILVENGVDLGTWVHGEPHSPLDREERNEVRLIFMGRMIPLKAIDILLESISLLRTTRPDLDVRLELLGDGPERVALEALNDRLGLNEVVTFHGFLKQSECAQHLAMCDVLVLPSIHECGGAVILEAMAMGKPVLATDWGGPQDYVDETCGVLVEPIGRDAMIEGFANGIIRLGESAQLRVQMGDAGRERVETEFAWSIKIDSILSIYERVGNR